MDRFGCKPFILLPVFGQLISDVGIFINYIFINYLPLEFFYIECVYGICGGNPVYFMGKLMRIPSILNRKLDNEYSNHAWAEDREPHIKIFDYWSGIPDREQTDNLKPGISRSSLRNLNSEI